MTDRLLAIESATDSLSVALLEGDQLVALEEADRTRQHASVLLPLIDEILREAGWQLGDLDALAVSSGPGSFTSLRIGLATAKGLAFGREMKAIGISTLEAMAMRAFDAQANASGASPRSRQILTLLDARRGEWYAGSWSMGEGGEWVAGLAEGLYSPEHLAADLAGPVVVVCPEPGDWRGEFESAGLRIEHAIEGPAARPRADWIGRLGARALAQGRGGAPRDLAARYLRRAEAEAKRLGGPVEAGEVARVRDPSAPA